MFQTISSLLPEATLETIYMVLIASLLAILVGLPLGTVLYHSQRPYSGADDA